MKSVALRLSLTLALTTTFWPAAPASAASAEVSKGGACYVRVIRENTTTVTCHQANLADCNRIVSQVRDAVRQSWEMGATCDPARETTTRR